MCGNIIASLLSTIKTLKAEKVTDHAVNSPFDSESYADSIVEFVFAQS